MQNIPDIRSSDSQGNIWTVWSPQREGFGPPANRDQLIGYPHALASRAEHLIMPGNLSSTSVSHLRLESARAEFQLATTHGRQRSRDQAALLGLEDDSESDSQEEELGSGEDDVSDADADKDEHDFAESLASLQENPVYLKKLAASDGTEIDMSNLLGRGGLFKPRQHKRSRQRIGQDKRFGRHIGPRKAAAPTPDISLRLARASQLFMNHKPKEARDELLEVIRINAETPSAWEVLATVSMELGDFDEAVHCLLFAAHFQRKHVSAWMRCVEYALELINGPLRAKYLRIAEYACASAVRAVPKDIQARMKKAAVYIELGKLKRAISEYKMIVKLDKVNTAALRKLAEVCIDHGEVNIAIQAYKTSLSYFKAPAREIESFFGWEDADAYITLYEIVGKWDIAISELKSLARWLLGREDEGFWDEFAADDREWDINDMRRIQAPAFSKGKYPQSVYGLGLPLEFRVKLGLCRLHLGQPDEAMAHLNLLHDPDEPSPSAVLDYPHLFRQAANELYEAKLYQAAIQFYQPLRQTPGLVDASLLVQIGRCFLHTLDDLQAAESFKAAIEVNEGDVDARMELAKIYERIKQPGKAFDYVTEIIELRNPWCPESGLQSVEAADNNKATETPQKAPKVHRSRIGQSSRGRLKQEDLISKAEYLQSQYQLLKAETDAMRAGNDVSSRVWMDAAKSLTDDFRSFKTFYPWDKYIRFLGYSRDTRLQAETSLDSDLTAMAERLSKDLGAEISKKASVPYVKIPEDYRGIPFRKWLDIFLEYALCLARNGKAKLSYEICEAAKDAIVFYHSREDMFLIQLCWCMCALIASDEETCVAVARFFMKEYQFTTDSYRMFAAVSRACHSPVSWYSSGPTQKFILRQIKAMDFPLVDEDRRQKHFTDKASYSARDEKGHLIIPKEMDIALLMLYGHILFTGTSYTYAMNYFFRAYSLDPLNPMVNLNIGLAYIHHALKRQTENRQYGIIQGVAFMRAYYESRCQDSRAEERQEAHYNMARAYHMLGLVHLAIPFYNKVLNEILEISEQPNHENLALDAAYNLQTIYAISGNVDLAAEVTRQWLVI